MGWRILEGTALVAAVACVAVDGVYAYTVRPELQMVGVLLALAMALVCAACVVRLLVSRSSERRRALTLLDVVLAAFALSYVSSDVGATYRDRAFVRRSALFERVVEQFRSGAIPAGRLPPDSLPGELRGCCYVVDGERDTTGQWRVEFWVSTGFPVHHSAWMYYSGTFSRAVLRDGEWYTGYKVAPHWYRVSD